MAGVLQHLRSSTLNKRPNPASMVDGQIAINYASGSPGAFFKDSNGNLVKVGPVHVGATAPNVSPASGGTAGNSLGEQWLDTSGGTYVFKIWDGATWRSEAGEFVNVTGDTMTGSLTMGPSANLIFEGSTDDGFETTLTVVDPTADRTITLPNVSGTVVTTGDSGTVTSTMIADGTIVNADVNASAAIAGTKISPDFGSQTIQTTGVFSHALGSQGAPTITFAGDTDTGIYSPGANQVAISTGGSGRLFVDASGNVTVDTNTFYVDATNNRVGIGTTSPSYLLDVAGTARIGATTGDATLEIGTGASANRNAYIDLVGDTTYTDYGTRIIRQGGGANADSRIQHRGTGALALETAEAGASIVFLQQLGERARIDSSGRLGVGTSSPGARFHVNQSASANAVTEYIRLSSDAGSDAMSMRIAGYAYAGNVKTAIDFIQNAASNFQSKIAFSTSSGSDAIERVRIDEQGRVGIGTTSPGQPLEVNGNIQGSNFLAPSAATYGVASNTRIGIVPTSVTNERIEFYVGASERARIDSSGRLLVGTSTSQGNGGSFQVGGDSAAGAAPTAELNAFGFDGRFRFTRATTGSPITTVANNDRIGRIAFDGYDGSAYREAANIVGEVDGTPGSNDMPGRLVFSTTADGASSPTERMRINKDGNVFINASSLGTNAYYFAYSPGNGFGDYGHVDGTASGVAYIRFLFNGVSIGSITQSGTTAVAYNTSSDYRLKENVTPVTDGITRLQQLKPSRFNFIADPAKTVDGFIAHEVQAVVPEAITGEKDAVDEDGNPQYQGIDQSKLVPLLTAALQEAIAKIESLEARLTAAGI